ncbi:4'-phosphopantetheinyl transferase family protein [Lysobacter terrae]
MLQIDVNPGGAGPQWPRIPLRDAFEDALPALWHKAPLQSVRIGLFDLHEWWPWLAEAYGMLDAAELRRVQSRRVPTDRHQLALSYSLHRLLLGAAMDCDPFDVPIGRDAKGCPCLAHTDLTTSLSHADHSVAVAIAAHGPVGVDIELAARAPVVPEIAERVCHPADIVDLDAGMAGLPGLSRSEALLALWVRKEAFLKAAGIGLQREMQTFAAPDGALLALPEGSAALAVRLRMLDAGPHWMAAVAHAPELTVTSAQLCPRIAESD